MLDRLRRRIGPLTPAQWTAVAALFVLSSVLALALALLFRRINSRSKGA